MNVEIGAEAALFPEKEYVNGIAVAVLKSRSADSTSSNVTLCSRSAALGQPTLASHKDHCAQD